MNVFVYGTLIEKSCLHELTGKQFTTSPAILKDFKKFTSHLGYLYIVPDKGSRVEGFLVHDVDPQSIQKLDRYESKGRLYMREKVVATCGRKKIPCETYVGNQQVLRPQT